MQHLNLNLVSFICSSDVLTRISSTIEEAAAVDKIDMLADDAFATMDNVVIMAKGSHTLQRTNAVPPMVAIPPLDPETFLLGGRRFLSSSASA